MRPLQRSGQQETRRPGRHPVSTFPPYALVPGPDHEDFTGGVWAEWSDVAKQQSALARSLPCRTVGDARSQSAPAGHAQV